MAVKISGNVDYSEVERAIVDMRQSMKSYDNMKYKYDRLHKAQKDN